MPNIDDFYILGLPIDMEIGVCKFITVEDYPDYSEILGVLTLDKNRIISNLVEQNTEGAYTEYLEIAKESSLFEIIDSIQQYREIYIELFSKLFDDEEIWEKVNKDNFDEIRKSIMKMNNIQEVESSPNPEIQKWIEKSQNKGDKGEGVDLASIVTSVHVATGTSYREIVKQTMFQLYMTFKRISKFKEFDSSILFATVAEKVDIKDWSSTIPIDDQASAGMSKSDFDDTVGKIFGS